MLENFKPWELGAIALILTAIITGIIFLFTALTQKNKRTNKKSDDVNMPEKDKEEPESDINEESTQNIVQDIVTMYGVSQNIVNELEKVIKETNPSNIEPHLKTAIDRYKKLEHRLENRHEHNKIISEAKEEFKAGNFEKTETLLLKAYNNYIKIIKQDQESAAEDAFELGCIKELQIEYQTAKQYYKQAINLAPENSLYLNQLADLLLNTGEFREPIALLKKALEIDKKLYEDNHPDITMELNKLGNACKFSGEYNKAIDYFEQGLNLGKKSFAENHSVIGTILKNLGAVWELLGEHTKASDCFQQAIKEFQTASVQNYTTILIPLNNFCNTWKFLSKYSNEIEKYKKLEQRLEHRPIHDLLINQAKKELKHGNLEKAEQFLEQCYQKDRDNFEKNKKFPAEYAFELGSLKRLLIDYQTARKYYEQAVNLSPNNSLYLNELSTLLHELGEYKQSIPLLEKALEINKTGYNEHLPDIAIHLNNLGAAFKSLGNYKEAIHYFEKALAIDRSNFGVKHPRISTRLSNLGATWRALSEYEKAIDYCKKGLEISGKDFIQDNDIAIHLNMLGYDGAESSGINKKAIRYFQKAFSILKKAHDEQITYIAICLNNLGSQWYFLGKYNNAINYFKKALAIFQKADGNNLNYIGICLNNLGTVYYSLKEYNKAISYFEKGLAILKKAYSEDHIYIGTCLNNLGNAWYSSGEHNKAIHYFEKSLVILKRKYFEEHIYIGSCLNQLGDVWYALEEYNKAIDYFESAEKIFFKKPGKDHAHTKLITKKIIEAKSKFDNDDHNEEEEEEEEEQIQ